MKIIIKCSKTLFALLLLSVSLLFSCQPPPPGAWRNQQIDADKRAFFADLNNKFFAAVKADKKSDVEALLSAEMLEFTNLPERIDHVGNYLKSNGFKLADEFYLVNIKKGINTVDVAQNGIRNYRQLNYNAIEKEMYIAYFVTNPPGDQKVLTLAYAKAKYGWRIFGITLNTMRIGGFDGRELFIKAKQALANGYLFDAYTLSAQAIECSMPGADMKYPAIDSVSYFASEVVNLANKHALADPLIKGVSTGPRIFRVLNRDISGQTIQAIYYLSQIKLNNTAALRAEYNQVRKNIEQTLPGATKNKKYLLFSAFNERPSATKNENNVDFIDTLK